MSGESRLGASGSASFPQGTKVPECSPKSRTAFGKVAAALWPSKTAEHVAYLGGVTTRAAKYWLSGEREPNGAIIAAVVQAITAKPNSRVAQSGSALGS